MTSTNQGLPHKIDLSAKDEVACGLGVVQDITGCKHVEQAIRESEETYRSLFETMAQGVIYCDSKGLVTSINPAAERILGRSLAEVQSFGVMGSGWQSIAEDGSIIPLHERALRKALDTGRPVYNAIHGVRNPKTNEVRWLLISAIPQYRLGEPQSYQVYSVFSDITERKQNEQSLHQSEQRLRLALEKGNFGSYQFDYVSQAYLSASDIYKANLGLTPQTELTCTIVAAAIHPEDRPHFLEKVHQLAHTSGDYATEYRCIWPDGSIHWISAYGTRVYSEIGELAYLIGITQDITERKEWETLQQNDLREAKERADRDPLTSLLNHRVFHERLEKECVRAQQENGIAGVVMMDIDNFKFFNDVYGHATGDDVLRRVADSLQTSCQYFHAFARFGGDEFAMLFRSAQHVTSKEIEARLRNDLIDICYQPSRDETPIPISISIGSAIFPTDNNDRHAVVRLATERLLRSKTGQDTDGEAQQIRMCADKHVAGFSMIDALVTSVHNKDRYTRRHSEDVMTYSLTIAKGLGMTETEQHTIALAALVHDVGKIGVPDSILRKPGKLTEEEFEAIKRHPQMGAIIVSAVEGLEATLDAVRHHHERWDGNGYPFGLRGEGIPLIARIMAVADAFSAMTTDRPYRKGMDNAKALSILRDGQGTQWDPICIQAFLAAYEKQMAA